MPPAWTPEKHNGNHYAEPDENINPEPGLVTPPRSRPNLPEEIQLSEREKRHIQWLLQKLTKLASIFRLHRQIGEGTFSAVFMASLLNDVEPQRLFAVKHLVPTTHPVRIEVELRCLQLIGGEDNVVGIDLCLRENENIVFVMPYLKHKAFSEYVGDMDVKETANYLKNLLKAIRRVHSFGIIHRDIKPNNFLYDRRNEQFLLVDFGLAQVCSTSTKPVLATSAAASTLENSYKRKREPETVEKPKDFGEPLAKRPALQKKNLNTLNFTVSHLQNSFANKTPTTISSKENFSNAMQLIVKKSPFKSPMKNMSKQILKSPFKFPGLDLPPTHSKFSQKMPGQRRLFDDDSDPKVPKFQKPMSITSRNPTKTTPTLDRKTKQTQLNLKPETKCYCFNKPSICNVCLLRKPQEAPRAGTPGFRPPEVLLKYKNQTTAVDIWAVGVIMLCILSGTYPFFRAPDDVTALAEIISMFGDEQMKKVAKIFGRHLMCSGKRPPLDLRKVCTKLRNKDKLQKTTERTCRFCEQFLNNCLCAGTPTEEKKDLFPSSAYDLLEKLLDVNPYTRITAEEALKHPFLIDF